MSKLQEWIELDQRYTLALNGSDSLFWDGFMTAETATFTWVPAAALLLYVIIKNNSLKECLITFGVIIFAVALTDQFSSSFCKPFFQRWRPTQDGELMYLVDVVNNYRGGRYGFISGHASNSFSIAMLFSLILKDKRFTFVMFGWAALFSFSRIYLGVHYVGDILFGTVWGCTSGLLCYGILCLLRRKFLPRRVSISAKFTSSGYLVSDIDFLLSALFLTFVYIIFRAIVFI